MHKVYFLLGLRVNYYLVHISRHLPKKILIQLEELYKVNTNEEIIRNIEVGTTIFDEAILDAKKNYMNT